MMACPMGKIILLWDQYFEKWDCIMLIMGLYIFTLCTYVFPVMACTMGKIIPLWEQYFEVGFSLC